MLNFDYQFPDYHPEDLAIPRTRLVAFEQHFQNRQPLETVDYIYRVDYLEHWTFNEVPFRARCLTSGHQYREELDNVLKYRGRNIGYIDEISALVAEFGPRRQVAQRLYVFPTLNGAKVMQIKSIAGDLNVEMNKQGELDFVHNPLYLFRSLGIISRVAVANVPAGSFFPDPNTPDDPAAAVHIVGSEHPVTIPPSSIEFCINNLWVNHDDVDIEAIEAAAKRGDVSSIFCDID